MAELVCRQWWRSLRSGHPAPWVSEESGGKLILRLPSELEAARSLTGAEHDTLIHEEHQAHERQKYSRQGAKALIHSP